MGKKETRARFRQAVFSRDGFQCVMCGLESSPEQVITDLDAHHITGREGMSNGGYVAENGISLCESCHLKAEAWLKDEGQPRGFSPDELYEKIGSSREEAERASKAL